MASQVLQRKLIEVQNSNFFSIRCDKYTDTSNKEQLSLCVRWVDKNLEAHEDDTWDPNKSLIWKVTQSLAYYRYALIQFNLSLSDLRGQTYDDTSNMMDPRSRVGEPLKKDYQKTLETSCQDYTLSLSMEYITKQSNRISKAFS